MNAVSSYFLIRLCVRANDSLPLITLEKDAPMFD